MKTAEEILEDYPHVTGTTEGLNSMLTIKRGFLFTLINEARKEVIEECAKRATAKADYYRGRFTGDAIVDRDSILNIIKELK